MRYENEICQGCGKIMQENEDIVVCPECGTPQHRECYNAENKCVNGHLHEDGFEWRAKHAEEEKEINSEPQDGGEKIICPFCRHENSADAKECSNCGQPFELFGRNIFPNGEQKYPSVEEEHRQTEYSYKPPFEVEKPEFENDDLYRTFNDNTNGQGSFDFNGYTLRNEIDGVENRDLALYLRTNVPKYHQKFEKIQSGGKTFNWAAFFFAPYWFFYRKLLKAGSVFLGVMLLLTVAFYNPMMEYMEFFTEFSTDSLVMQMSGLAESEYDELTDEQYAQLEEEVELMMEKINKLMPPMLLFIALNLLLHIAAGFVADGMYKKKVIGDIKRINSTLLQESNPQHAKYLAYMKEGGTSAVYTVLSYGVQYIVSMIISQLMYSGMM